MNDRELVPVSILVPLAFLVFVGLLVKLSGGPRSPQEGPEAPTPYQDCQELPGAHTWAPEGFRIIHLQCPEAP